MNIVTTIVLCVCSSLLAFETQAATSTTASPAGYHGNERQTKSSEGIATSRIGRSKQKSSKTRGIFRVQFRVKKILDENELEMLRIKLEKNAELILTSMYGPCKVKYTLKSSKRRVRKSRRHLKSNTGKLKNSENQTEEQSRKKLPQKRKEIDLDLDLRPPPFRSDEPLVENKEEINAPGIDETSRLATTTATNPTSIRTTRRQPETQKTTGNVLKEMRTSTLNITPPKTNPTTLRLPSLPLTTTQSTTSEPDSKTPSTTASTAAPTTTTTTTTTTPSTNEVSMGDGGDLTRIKQQLLSSYISSSNDGFVPRLIRQFEACLQPSPVPGQYIVPIKEYTTAYEHLCQIFDMFGTIFAFAGEDIRSKLSTLLALQDSDKDREEKHYFSMQSMFEYEYSLTENNRPGTSTNRLITVALRYIAALVHTVTNSQDDLPTQGRVLYDEILAPEHPWYVRMVVYMALLSFPTRETLLEKLELGDNETSMEQLRQLSANIETLYCQLQGLYDKYDV